MKRRARVAVGVVLTTLAVVFILAVCCVAFAIAMDTFKKPFPDNLWNFSVSLCVAGVAMVMLFVCDAQLYRVWLWTEEVCDS